MCDLHGVSALSVNGTDCPFCHGLSENEMLIPFRPTWTTCPTCDELVHLSNMCVTRPVCIDCHVRDSLAEMRWTARFGQMVTV